MNHQDKEITVAVGYQSVVMDKVFGASVFMNLRITADINTCEWVIERQTVLPCPDPEIEHTVDWVKWVEWCRIPGQFDWEFRKDD